MSPVPTYAPERRTALLLCGTGAHGAYHAGVLRALHEAGVKVDIYAGHGMGAAGAALAAIGGAPRLWEKDGLWLDPAAAAFYGWYWPVRALGWGLAAVMALLLVPVAVLGVGLLAIPLGYLVQMVAPEAGAGLLRAYGWITAWAFAGPHLPTFVPRLVTLVLVLLAAALAVHVAGHRRDPGRRRRAKGAWWWRIAGAPIDAATPARAVLAAIWQLVRGAHVGPVPGRDEMGRRFSDVLTDSLGQPGFGELVLVVTDLDARRDLVAALLREPHRAEFLAPRGGRDRRSDVIDLAGDGRDLGLDAVSAALCPPLWCEPAPLTFSPESYWRGETHRCCDRPGVVSRLLEEVAAAGASQVIIVTAVQPIDTPHRLTPPVLDVRGRLGQFHVASEAAAMRDALEMARLRFDAIHVIAPAHNPIGPFDCAGVYDAASDRQATIGELLARGYDDACRQFIEPVVGASGERLDGSGVEGHGRTQPSGLMAY